jgi:hypothetical protein
MRAQRLTLLAGCFCAGVVLGGVPPLIRARGWAPLVALGAPNDPPLAVDRLEEGVQTFGAILTGLDVDEGTQEFLSELRGNLGSLDLQGFYETLPERTGRWRQVRLSGTRRGEAYELRRVPGPTPCRVDPEGPLGDRLGDLALELGARPVGDDLDGNYLAHLSLGFGTGHFGLDRIQAYLRALGRLAASCDPNNSERVKDTSLRPGAQTRLELLENSPKLRGEDVEVVGVLAEAYPSLFRVLRRTISVEDVLVYAPNGSGDYQQVRLRARLRPDLLEPTYPEMADYLQAIGPLMRASFKFADARGRTFLTLTMDTRSLALQLDGFLAGGRLLPVEHGRVLTAEPLDPPNAPRLVVVSGKVESEINGIVTKIDGIQLASTVLPLANGYDVLTTMRKVPQVSVSGSAFGILPTWAIDVVIPGNMEELTTEFLATACEGNDGQGVLIGFRARHLPGGRATLAGETQLEVLNNALVSLAFRVANMKLLPSDEVRSEIWDLLRELQVAFGDDLHAYATQVRDE